MADKSFGVRELNLLTSSGTPTITSPNNLNLNANNVAISTNITVGQNITISANAGIASLNVTGVSTFVGVTTFKNDIYVVGNQLLSINDALTFRGSNGGNSFMSNYIDTSGGAPGNLYIGNISGDIHIDSSEHFSVKTNTNEQAILATQNGSVALYHDGGNKKLETSNTGVTVTGTLAATAVTGDGSGLTGISAGISTSAWTISNNSSSNYVISGPGGLSSANNPDLYLVRGQTYQFIMNASGHGFGIQTVSGTWTGSNAYTTGITNAGADTGTITFQVPYSAPERLYYACTSQHSGMVGNIYIQGGPSDIKMADQWRRTATLNTSNGENFLTTDWARVSGGGLGTYVDNGGMSQSGGIFTFPRTGIYLVTWQAYAETSSTSGVNAVNIYVTTDNNSYNNRASSVFSMEYDMSGYNYGNGLANAMIDVTDTSQVKVKFRVYSSGSVAWDVASTQNRNCATFLRIGDT